jgi:tetratricopeptide (TPR) repeat protein
VPFVNFELIHTSAPKGLRPGSRGFTIVAMTDGIPPPLSSRLEALSGYRFLFDAVGADAVRNPPAISHYIVTLGGRKYHVVSRVAPAGSDYSGRTNKLAHHVVVSDPGLLPGGPAALCQSAGLFRDTWNEDPRIIPTGPKLNAADGGPQPCAAWAAACRDAGWGGHLLDLFAQNPRRLVCVLYPPGVDALVLVSESLALLPQAERWQISFTTALTSDLPADVQCSWRFVPRTPETIRSSRMMPGAVVLDLTELPVLAESRFVDAARAGKSVRLREEVHRPRPVRPLQAGSPDQIVPALDLDAQTAPTKGQPPARRKPVYESRDLSPLWIDDEQPAVVFPRRRRRVRPWLAAAGAASLAILAATAIIGILWNTRSPASHAKQDIQPDEAPPVDDSQQSAQKAFDELKKVQNKATNDTGGELLEHHKGYDTTEGQGHFDKGEYGEAMRIWKEARELLKEARELLAKLQAAADSSNASAIAEAQTQMNSAIDDAKTQMKAGKYKEAAKILDGASKNLQLALEKAEEETRKPENVNRKLQVGKSSQGAHRRPLVPRVEDNQWIWTLPSWAGTSETVYVATPPGFTIHDENGALRFTEKTAGIGEKEQQGQLSSEGTSTIRLLEMDRSHAQKLGGLHAYVVVDGTTHNFELSIANEPLSQLKVHTSHWSGDPCKTHPNWRRPADWLPVSDDGKWKEWWPDHPPATNQFFIRTEKLRSAGVEVGILLEKGSGSPRMLVKVGPDTAMHDYWLEKSGALHFGCWFDLEEPRKGGH